MAELTPVRTRALLALVASAVALVGLVACGGGKQNQAVANYPTRVHGAVVTAGNPAPHTLDIYEDFLCPICGRFEANYGNDIARAINQGKIQVRYHPVAILNRSTNPTGYSLRAANAGVCSAAEGFFPAYHAKLFAEQPAEGSAGLTDQQLITMGQQVGAPAGFAQCVTSHKYVKAVAAETTRAIDDASLRAPGASGFGTPTVLADGKQVNRSDDDWLNKLTGES